MYNLSSIFKSSEPQITAPGRNKHTRQHNVTTKAARKAQRAARKANR